MTMFDDEDGVSIDELLRGRGIGREPAPTERMPRTSRDTGFEGMTVNPESINLYEKLLPPEAQKKLEESLKKITGREIIIKDRILDFLYDYCDVQIGEGLITGASILARARKPDFPIIPFTPEQVEELVPAAQDLEGQFGLPWFLGINSEIATRAINSALPTVAQNINRELITRIPEANPQQMFLEELQRFYNMIVRAKEDFNSTPEKVFQLLLTNATYLLDKNSQADPEFRGSLFPLISNLLLLSGLQAADVRKLRRTKYNIPTTAILPELLTGIEKFLTTKKLGHYPVPKDLGKWSITRRLVTQFGSKDLKTLQEEIPNILDAVHTILPKSTQGTVNAILDCAESVAILGSQGNPVLNIMEMIFGMRRVS